MPNETPEDIARMAPAAICSVVCRIVRLRKFLELAVSEGEITEGQARRFDAFVAPFSFEEEILSSKQPLLRKAINRMGLEAEER